MSNPVRKITQEMPKEDRKILGFWAEEAQRIRNDETISKKEKIKKLIVVTNKSKIPIKFLKFFFKILKKNSWDDRGWPARMAFMGFIPGVAIFGSKMAGLATAGMGIGIPIYLLSAAGGALLGTIIEEMEKKD